MHVVFIVHALLHGLAIAIIGFFILFAASRSSGLLKAVGNFLGIAVFVIAGIIVVGGLTAPMFGGKPFGMDMMGHHGGWMHGPMGPQGPPPADATPPAKPDATSAAPATAPATPAPAAPAPKPLKKTDVSQPTVRGTKP